MSVIYILQSNKGKLCHDSLISGYFWNKQHTGASSDGKSIESLNAFLRILYIFSAKIEIRGQKKKFSPIVQFGIFKRIICLPL